MKSKTFQEISSVIERGILTGNKLFDEWFSRDGGIVPETTILVTGTSGAGKTTLMVNLMNWLPDYTISFYSREMAKKSIKHQIRGYNFNNPNAYFADEDDCPHLEDYLKELDELCPKFVIVDSMQAVAIQDYPEMHDQLASVKVREMLMEKCREIGATLFIIGHNTKDNQFEGKNTNMQMVDAHMVLEADDKTNVRKMYWGFKNRKGPKGTLNYRINKGSVDFYKPFEEVNFFDSFNGFVESYCKQLDQSDQKYIEFRKEFSTISRKLFKKYENNRFQYLNEIMIQFHQALSKHGLD